MYGETITNTPSGAHGLADAGIVSAGPLNLKTLQGTPGVCPSNCYTWVGGTSGAIFTPTGSPVASATTAVVTAVTGSPNNSGTWIGKTSAAIFAPTASPVAEANWTTNQFVGMLTSVSKGTNAGCQGIITGNTANAVTMSAGWTTPYWQNSCGSPDTTSIFSIGPNLVGGGTQYSCATGSTSACASTGMTLVGQPEDTIGGGVPNGDANGCAHIDAENVSILGGGGSIKTCGDSVLKNVTVTYPGWMDYAGDGGT